MCPGCNVFDLSRDQACNQGNIHLQTKLKWMKAEDAHSNLIYAKTFPDEKYWNNNCHTWGITHHEVLVIVHNPCFSEIRLGHGNKYKFDFICHGIAVVDFTLQWRHAMACQITRLTIVYSTRHWSKKTSKLSLTGLCDRNSPVTGEFPAQRASNTENVSISWRHHVFSTIRNLADNYNNCKFCFMLLTNFRLP